MISSNLRPFYIFGIYRPKEHFKTNYTFVLFAFIDILDIVL